MKPDDNNLNTRNNPPGGMPNQQSVTDLSARDNAVVGLARQELNQIYSSDPHHNMSVPQQPNTTTADKQDTPAATTTTENTITRDFHLDPSYDRTLGNQTTSSTSAEWQKYHTAWQTYYQEYFRRYYANSLAEANARAEQGSQSSLTPTQAREEIKSEIKQKISKQARKIRHSRHFIPIISAVGVMLIFVFLQYNTILTGYAAAYISPGAISPSNVIVDPNESDIVSNEPRLIIPKIAVDVPVIYDNTMGKTSAETAAKQDAALEKGVAWFGIPGADSHPGQLGNTVLAGHSSNDWLAPGDYKFVFARLDQLKKGDVIYVNYQNIRYTYTVTNKKVINPNDISALYQGDTKPILTLLTCTPVGTALNRLLVYAEQVSPSPSAADKSPDNQSSGGTTEIPGNSPTALERLFGAN